MTELILYLKAPVAGQVKTRLQTRYSPEAAAALCAAFIADTVDAAAAVEADRYTAAYAGDQAGIDSLVPPDWNIVAQVDGDLGTRMLASLRRSVDEGAERVILIGSDLPTIPTDHFKAAIERLLRADVVLGPTTDGGFYLVGTRIHLPDIFADVAWSTDKAFEETATGIREHELQLALIPPGDDIDTPEDLDRALAGQAPMPHTRRAVADLS